MEKVARFLSNLKALAELFVNIQTKGTVIYINSDLDESKKRNKLKHKLLHIYYDDLLHVKEYRANSA